MAGVVVTVTGPEVTDPDVLRYTPVDGAPPWSAPPDVYGQLQADDLVYRFTYGDASTRTVVAQAVDAAMAVSDGERRATVPGGTQLPAAWAD